MADQGYRLGTVKMVKIGIVVAQIFSGLHMEYLIWRGMVQYGWLVAKVEMVVIRQE